MFPTTVGVFKYQNNFDKEFKYIQSVEYIKNVSNYKSQDSFILSNKKLKKLKTFFDESIKNYSKEVLGVSHNLKITQSWCNQNNKGSEHHPHYHPNSILSGVFYFKVEGTGCPIVFSTSDKKQIIFSGKNTPYNYSNMLFEIKDGELILFPSNVQHQVPVNHTELVRFSLSFNTFIFESFGDMSALSYVDNK